MVACNVHGTYIRWLPAMSMGLILDCCLQCPWYNVQGIYMRRLPTMSMGLILYGCLSMSIVHVQKNKETDRRTDKERAKKWDK